MRILSRFGVLSILICALFQFSAAAGTDAEIKGQSGFVLSGSQTGIGIYFALLSQWPAMTNRQDEPAWAAESDKPARTAGPVEPVKHEAAAEPASSSEKRGSGEPTYMNRPRSPGTGTKDKLTPVMKIPYFQSEKLGRYLDFMRTKRGFSYEDIVTRVNIGIDRPFYTDIHVIEDPDSLTVLVNKYNKLPDGYTPVLVKIDPAFCVPLKGGQALRPEAKKAFEQLSGDARDLGLVIQAYGTYRSIPAQTYIWNREIKEGKTIEEVDEYHARGGFSEHSTGLAVDVIGTGYGISGSKEYAWYRDNAHKYGFIIRYEREKESVTGYKYEPWHLRYVGLDVAAAVYESGLTYDEYYVRYLSQKPR